MLVGPDSPTIAEHCRMLRRSRFFSSAQNGHLACTAAPPNMHSPRGDGPPPRGLHAPHPPLAPKPAMGADMSPPLPHRPAADYGTPARPCHRSISRSWRVHRAPPRVHARPPAGSARARLAPSARAHTPQQGRPAGHGPAPPRARDTACTSSVQASVHARTRAWPRSVDGVRTKEASATRSASARRHRR